MFERESTLLNLLLGYCRSLSADIEESALGEVPAEGIKPPAWTLGHLAIVADRGRHLFGEPLTCPKLWHDHFGTGSDASPSALPQPLPSKADLLSAIENGYDDVRRLASQAAPEVLNAPNPLPIPLLQKTLPTVGDLIAHLLTTHLAMHLGQLSTWRRAKGFREFF